MGTLCNDDNGFALAHITVLADTVDVSDCLLVRESFGTDHILDH